MTSPPRWAEEFVTALLPVARRFNAAIVEGLLDLNRRLEEARTMTTAPVDLTAPIIVRDFPAMVALVDQYAPAAEWHISERPDLGRAWVLQWDRLTLTVGDLGDLELARYIVAERTRARQALRRIVVDAVTSLGLEHPGRFRHPADPVVNAGLTRCPVCSCHVRASGHRPGSEDCLEGRAERLLSIAS